MMLLALVLFATLMTTWSIIPAMCHPDASPVFSTLHASEHLKIRLLPTPVHVPLSITNDVLYNPNVIDVSLVKKTRMDYENNESNMDNVNSLANATNEISMSRPSLNPVSKMLKSHIAFDKKPVPLTRLNYESIKSFYHIYKNNKRNSSVYLTGLKDVFKIYEGSEIRTFSHVNTEQDKIISRNGGQNNDGELLWILTASRSSKKEKPQPKEPTSPSPYPQTPQAAYVHPSNDKSFRYHRISKGMEMKRDTLNHKLANSDKQYNVSSLKNNDLHRSIISTQNFLREYFSLQHMTLASGNSTIFSHKRNHVSLDSNVQVNTVNSFDKNTKCDKFNSGRCIIKRSARFQVLENSPVYKIKNKVKQTNLSDVGFSTKSSISKSNSIDTLNQTLRNNVSHFSNENVNRQRIASFPRYPRYIKSNSNLSRPRSRQQHKKSNSSPKARQSPSRPGRHRRRRPGRGKRRDRRMKGLSLWIDSKQVKTFSGYVMEIFVIHNSRVLPYILDPNFEGQLPVIPTQVEVVNFTWRSGSKKYLYTFDHMYSNDESLLAVPTLSIPRQGRVPRKPRVFSVEMHCTGNASGIATFGIGLSLYTQQRQPLTGTPLRLQLRKECNYMGPDPECDEKCDNGGVCDEGQRCVCAEGYLGPYCSAALCYPRCMNGGTCTSPGRCSCPPGFNGRHCEGGICQRKCQNGGKCVQKDTCECRRGYYGNQCEFSKCVIPCVNGGRCRDVNKCRCPRGFSGDHCEVILSPWLISPTAVTTPARCLRHCRHGSCLQNSTCHCHRGYTGRWCRRRSGRGSGRHKKKVWI